MVNHHPLFLDNMRLITHNMLKCNIRGVEDGYPLKIEASNTEVIEADFDAGMITNLLGKIDWKALQQAALDLDIPDLEGFDEITDEILSDEESLKKIHHVLLEVHVMDGNLVCPSSGRKFGVKGGIPNMLLHEDEV